jgi:hypothetical protein
MVRSPFHTERTLEEFGQNGKALLDIVILVVLAAGKEEEVLSQINVGATIYATPVVANGTLYIASRGGWLWAVTKRSAGRSRRQTPHP